MSAGRLEEQYHYDVCVNTEVPPSNFHFVLIVAVHVDKAILLKVVKILSRACICFGRELKNLFA